MSLEGHDYPMLPHSLHNIANDEATAILLNAFLASFRVALLSIKNNMNNLGNASFFI